MDWTTLLIGFFCGMLFGYGIGKGHGYNRGKKEGEKIIESLRKELDYEDPEDFKRRHLKSDKWIKEVTEKFDRAQKKAIKHNFVVIG